MKQKFETRCPNPKTKCRVRKTGKEEKGDVAALAKLASSLQSNGSCNDALDVKEQVLAFRRRVLQADHPDIADAMGSLAASDSDLGRHAQGHFTCHAPGERHREALQRAEFPLQENKASHRLGCQPLTKIGNKLGERG
jgi:hypothetical protein